MSRVLITGGGGFIGAHLARFLADRDHEVDLVNDLSRRRLDADLEALQERPNVPPPGEDLLAPDALGDLSTDYGLIFHLAAIVGVANVLEAPDLVLRRNVELLVSALEFAARQSDLERFVFASTSEVYAGTLGLRLPASADTGGSADDGAGSAAPSHLVHALQDLRRGDVLPERAAGDRDASARVYGPGWGSRM